MNDEQTRTYYDQRGERVVIVGDVYIPFPERDSDSVLGRPWVPVRSATVSHVPVEELTPAEGSVSDKQTSWADRATLYSVLDHAVRVGSLVHVPWCETHDSEMLSDYHGECARWQFDYEQDSIECPCRLQDPPKVWREP